MFAMAARISIYPDTWWYLRAGKWILENGAVPQTTPFPTCVLENYDTTLAGSLKPPCTGYMTCWVREA